MKSNGQFQSIINVHRSPEEIVDLYKGFVIEELKELQTAKTLPQIIKEACDVIIVCDPVILHGDALTSKLHQGISDAAYALGGEGIGLHNFLLAMDKVVESNFSKLLVKSELVDCNKHYVGLGIKVKFTELEDGLFSVVSMLDQTVDGKFYVKDKVLKPHKYAPVDETVEFWR